MNRGYGRCVWAVVVIFMGAALALPTSVQAYDLTGAQLGSASSITIEIPKTGNAQVALPLRVHFSGGGANCTTGNLSTYWHGNAKDPVGVSAGFSSSGIGIPAPFARTVAINVQSTAQPMAARAWTIVVPRGTCGGSNQTATVHLTLTKKH